MRGLLVPLHRLIDQCGHAARALCGTRGEQRRASEGGSRTRGARDAAHELLLYRGVCAAHAGLRNESAAAVDLHEDGAVR